MLKNLKIRQAERQDLNSLAELFNDYRRFYKQTDDVTKARDFIEQRLKAGDAKIFVAEDEAKKILGFCQLYPTWSSISMRKAWIFNDLYVREDARKLGIGKQLIEHLLSFCKQTNAAWVTLQTAKDNTAGQSLYKKLGFTEEDHFLTFNYEF